VLDEAMLACDAVIVSNPHNPTGQVIQRADLVEVAARYPGSVLVVDESYIDFLSDPAPITLVGCRLGNVIVLRSPSKFFGLAGVRSGAAWSAHSLPACLRTDRTSWSVSAFAAQALKAALADTAWAARARQHLASDAAWLTQGLGACGLDIAPGTLHFRLLTGPSGQITRFAAGLEAHGIAVRVLDEACGIGKPAVRISAPPVQERAKLAAALQTLEGQQ
jgi:histidinol-phosphate aminotransferase